MVIEFLMAAGPKEQEDGWKEAQEKQMNMRNDGIHGAEREADNKTRNRTFRSHFGSRLEVFWFIVPPALILLPSLTGIQTDAFSQYGKSG